MAREFFKDLPNTTTPLTASRLNGLLNGDEALGSIVVDDVNCKNMWIPTLYVGNTQILQTRCSVTLSGDTYSFVASGTDMFIGNVWTSTGNDYNGTLGTLYKVKPNTSYTLSCSNSNFSKNFITFYGSDKKSLSYQELTSNVATFTTPNNCEYITIRVGNGSATSGTTYTTTIQLEKGSTATEYIEYKQPVKKTSIGVKEDATFYANDFKCRNLFNSKIYIKNINVGVSVPVFNFKLKPNTTYTMSTNMPQDSSLADIFVGGGILSTMKTQANGVWLNNPRTFTTDNDGNVSMSYRKLTNIGDFTTFWYQVEVGSEATPYTPYKEISVEDTGWVDLSSYVNTTNFTIRPGFNPQARKIGNMVFFKGAVYCTTAPNSNITNLLTNIPNQFRPSQEIASAGARYGSTTLFRIWYEEGNIKIQEASNIPTTQYYQGYALSSLVPYLVN